MSTTQKLAAREAAAAGGHKFEGRAALWLHFVFHSMQFLEIGGRLGFVLPQSLLFADYSNSLKSALSQMFERVFIVCIDEQLFKSTGSEEKTAVLLAEGYREWSLWADMQVFSGSADQGIRAIRALNGTERHGAIVGEKWRSAISREACEWFDIVALTAIRAVVRCRNTPSALLRAITPSSWLMREHARDNYLPAYSLSPILYIQSADWQRVLL